MSSENLPEIPKEWNLTEEQRTSMVKAQRKTIETENKRRAIQQEILNKFNEHSSMSPPQYPIVVVIKENNKIEQEINLMDSNQNFIYAKSFDDATTKVKNEINNTKSEIVKKYNNGSHTTNKLRISSDNKKGPPETDKFSLLTNGNYKYWEIITTNAAKSLLSSFRKTIKSKGGRKTKRKMMKNTNNSKSKKVDSKKNKRK
jgi:hypothetical protein